MPQAGPCHSTCGRLRFAVGRPFPTTTVFPARLLEVFNVMAHLREHRVALVSHRHWAGHPADANFGRRNPFFWKYPWNRPLLSFDSFRRQTQKCFDWRLLGGIGGHSSLSLCASANTRVLAKSVSIHHSGSSAGRLSGRLAHRSDCNRNPVVAPQFRAPALAAYWNQNRAPPCGW